MRALIIISASLATVMEPSRTWATNSFTRFLPRSLALASCPNRPDSTIWSSNPTCSFSIVVVEAACFLASAIGPSSFGLNLALQLVELLGVANCIQQHFLQLVVALQLSAQIRQPGSKIKQFLERLDLLGYVAWLEVIHLLELQIDLELRRIRIVTQLV